MMNGSYRNLEGLIKLERLAMNENPVSDISVVAKFPSLNNFTFNTARPISLNDGTVINWGVEDPSPLLQSSLREGDYVFISDAEPIDINTIEVIKSLISRGVQVNCWLDCGGSVEP